MQTQLYVTQFNFRARKIAGSFENVPWPQAKGLRCRGFKQIFTPHCVAAVRKRDFL